MSQIFDQKVVLYSLISEYNESNDWRVSLILMNRFLLFISNRLSFNALILIFKYKQLYKSNIKLKDREEIPEISVQKIMNRRAFGIP